MNIEITSYYEYDIMNIMNGEISNEKNKAKRF